MIFSTSASLGPDGDDIQVVAPAAALAGHRPKGRSAKLPGSILSQSTLAFSSLAKCHDILRISTK